MWYFHSPLHCIQSTIDSEKPPFARYLVSDCNEEDALPKAACYWFQPSVLQKGDWIGDCEEKGAAEWPHGLNWAVMGPKPDLFHTTKQKLHMEGISSISPEPGPETNGDPEACYDTEDRSQLFERLKPGQTTVGCTACVKFNKFKKTTNYCKCYSWYKTCNNML